MTPLEQVARIIWDAEGYDVTYDWKRDNEPLCTFFKHTNRTAQAIIDAGLLTDETELRDRIATELEMYATTQPGQGFGVYHNAAKTIRNPK